MALNMSSIMGRVNQFAKSKEGMLRQHEAVQYALKHNNGVLASGAKCISDVTMEQAVAKFIHVLCETAKTYGLPQSVMNHLETADVAGGLHIENGEGVARIYFGGDMFRPSLYEDYRGPNDEEGATNIVAIFNNGYHATKYVYGNWTGQEVKSSSSGGNADLGRTPLDYRGATIGFYNDPFIRSRKDREGLHFIQQAIDDFNGNYGSEFNVVAKIDDPIYEE